MSTLDLVLDTVARGAADLDIADAVTGGELERTIEGASTLTLELHDPHRKVIRHKALLRSVDFEFDKTWWRLVKVSKSADTVTLTFEDRDVAYLRRHKGPRKVYRKKHTRAQFVRMLVREVGRRAAEGKKGKLVGKQRIRFYCPEVNERQPIGKPKEKNEPHRRRRAERDTRRQRGLSNSEASNLTVQGKRATPEQRRNGQRVLDVADQLGAGPKATKALMEAVIVESWLKNLSYGDADSIGILQLRVSLHGRAAASSIEKSCRLFLTRGFTGRGGAIALAREHGDKSAGWVAQQVQGSAYPDRYDQVGDEAAEWIEAYGGASGTDTGGTSEPPRRKRYEFSRGEPGRPEDSWTCIQRLASEVNWRCFMDRGTLYFVSESRLRKSSARYIVSEHAEGVNWIDFDLDYGKVDSELRMSCRADLFNMRIGSVVVVRDMGLANGRYLVSTVRRGIFDADTEVTLKRPTPKLPEPQAETRTRTGGSRAGQGDVTITAGGSGAGTLRDRIVAVAEASAASYRRNPGAWFYSQGGRLYYGDPIKPPPSGTRSDCSQWVAAVYKKAGAPAPGPSYGVSIWTGNMRVHGRAVSLNDAQPGDLIWWPSHVELYVGPGSKTIGHGSAPVDAGTWNLKPGATCWRYGFLD
jgi:cell wall-associated NlpC family hydrolase